MAEHPQCVALRQAAAVSHDMVAAAARLDWQRVANLRERLQAILDRVFAAAPTPREARAMAPLTAEIIALNDRARLDVGVERDRQASKLRHLNAGKRAAGAYLSMAARGPD